jgi:hypothetical protein
MVLCAVLGDFSIELFRAVRLAALSLYVEESDDHLGDIRVGGEFSPGPRGSEIREIPSRRDESVETLVLPKDGLDGAVGEIVFGKERRLLSFLPLPRHGPISASAAQRCPAVLVLLDANDDALWCRHNALSNGAFRLSPAFRCIP